MPFQLQKSLVHQKTLEGTDKLYGVENTEPSTARFKQASQGTHDKREDLLTALFAASARGDYRAALEIILDDFKYVEEAEQLNFLQEAVHGLLDRGPKGNEAVVVRFSKIKMLDVYSTMVFSNLQNKEGEPLFHFKPHDEALDMSEAAFQMIWDALPPIVARELREGALDANPDWRIGSNRGEALSGGDSTTSDED
jgi:hypothetical protein